MIIYKVTNLVNSKIYIGLTTRALEVRKSEHISDAFVSKSNCVFHKALRKYGEENFSWEIIDTAKTQDELNEKEIYWIAFYNSCVKVKNSEGYNETFGGEGRSGYVISEETRVKMSKAQKGKTISDETKKKLSILAKGRIHTEESKMKISDSTKGSNNPRAILSEDDVLQIKELIKTGMSLTKIAKEYDVTQTNINDIKLGRSWSHVGDDVSYVKYSSIQYFKLTEDDVRKIKILLRDTKLTQAEIAEMFGVCREVINKINTGKSWKHIEI